MWDTRRFNIQKKAKERTNNTKQNEAKQKMTSIYPVFRHICGGSRYKVTRNREDAGLSF